MTGCRGSANLDPTGIVVNPANWQTIRLAKDSSGQYMGGGPFVGPYGGPQGPASGTYFSAGPLWGVPVIVTTSIGAGTALLGSFATASVVYRRSGVTVEASNSHSDFFQRDLTAMRAEERIGLAVFRPAAFAKVVGLA
jgi:HK97 family phage major capsid protein